MSICRPDTNCLRITWVRLGNVLLPGFSQAKGKLFMTEAIWYKQLFKDLNSVPWLKSAGYGGNLTRSPAFLDTEYERLALSARLNFKIFWGPCRIPEYEQGQLISVANISIHRPLRHQPQDMIERAYRNLDEKINAFNNR